MQYSTLSLNNRFACPHCRADLDVYDKSISCTGCGREFPCESGIPRLIPEDEASSLPDTGLDLSVLILARNEGPNLRPLLREMDSILGDLDCEYELLLVDGNSTDATVQNAKDLGAKVFIQEKPGYGLSLIHI